MLQASASCSCRTLLTVIVTSQEECHDLLFTPRILNYPLKEERPRIWAATGQQLLDTHNWHREKNSRLDGLRVQLRGVRC